MNNIEKMLKDLNEEMTLLGEFQNYGYYDSFVQTTSRYIMVLGCRYCGNLVAQKMGVFDLRDATTNMLVVHAVHCTGVSLGVRVVRADRERNSE